MNKALTVAVGILAIHTALCVAQDAKPAPKDVVFEDRPLRSWLEDLSGSKDPPAGGNDRDVLAEKEKAEAALRRFCAKPEKAVPALTAALADENEHVREAAVRCLGYYCKTEAKSLIPALRKTLKEDKSDAVRIDALIALADVGPREEVVWNALVLALQEDKSALVRANAIDQLCDIKPAKPATLVPSLIAALKDKDAGVRCEAVLAVGKLAKPRIAIPVLIDALIDDDPPARSCRPGVRVCAAMALSDLCLEAIPALVKALEHKNPRMRVGALLTLTNAPDTAWPLIRKELSMIVPLLEDEDTSVRANAAGLLGMIHAVDAVTDLIAKIDDKDEWVSSACMEALGRIGPDAALAAPRLTIRLQDRKAKGRCEAARALGRIGPKAKVAVHVLMEALSDEDKELRRYAAEALGEMGQDAIAAVPKLKQALMTDDKDLKQSAQEALKKIGVEP